jgi:hypothetical protein
MSSWCIGLGTNRKLRFIEQAVVGVWEAVGLLDSVKLGLPVRLCDSNAREIRVMSDLFIMDGITRYPFQLK